MRPINQRHPVQQKELLGHTDKVTRFGGSTSTTYSHVLSATARRTTAGMTLIIASGVEPPKFPDHFRGLKAKYRARCPPIAPTLPQKLPRDPPEPRRSLAVVPLIANQRYYGETPARLRRGYGGVGGRGRYLTHPTENSGRAIRHAELSMIARLAKTSTWRTRAPFALRPRCVPGATPAQSRRDPEDCRATH